MASCSRIFFELKFLRSRSVFREHTVSPFINRRKQKGREEAKKKGPFLPIQFMDNFVLYEIRIRIVNCKIV